MAVEHVEQVAAQRVDDLDQPSPLAQVAPMITRRSSPISSVGARRQLPARAHERLPHVWLVVDRLEEQDLDGATGDPRWVTGGPAAPGWC